MFSSCLLKFSGKAILTTTKKICLVIITPTTSDLGIPDANALENYKNWRLAKNQFTKLIILLEFHDVLRTDAENKCHVFE